MTSDTLNMKQLPGTEINTIPFTLFLSNLSEKSSKNKNKINIIDNFRSLGLWPVTIQCLVVSHPSKLSKMLWKERS